jgi:hypothetical protein
LGTFGGKHYTLTESKEILNEAKSIRKGKIPDKNAITFTNIKRFDYNGNRIIAKNKLNLFFFIHSFISIFPLDFSFQFLTSRFSTCSAL